MLDFDFAAFFSTFLHFGYFKPDGIQDSNGLDAPQHFNYFAIHLLLLS